MNKLKIIGICIIMICISNMLFGQLGVLKGTITDGTTNDPIIGANIMLVGKSKGTVSDIDGTFIFDDLTPGLYTIEVSYVGYASQSYFEIEISGSRPVVLDVPLYEGTNQLEEIVVRGPAFKKTLESPVSIRTIGVSEIRRNPGGNRDISRVVQALPGVTSTASFRNDLIIRGGAPNENRFFVDDVEVPIINHFATQGSSGGPAGIINVDLIREVDFYSGAFPVTRGNSLSSVFNFKLRDGRDDRLGFSAIVGATDIGITLEGPASEKTTFLLSARRSYLQFLFKAIGLPFLPTYTDFNAKIKHKIDNKSEIYFIGLGAIDDFSLNLEAGTDETSRFILERLPVNTQWNYTNGLVYKRYHDNGYTNFVISRNMLNNEAIKYINNDDSKEENLVLKYASQEIENKLRIETYRNKGQWTYIYGAGYEFIRYNNSTFNQVFTNSGAETIDYISDVAFHKFAVFGNVGRKFASEKLSLNIGGRLDANTFSSEMANPLEQFSPRVALSYQINDWLAYNANAGIYYQLPPFPVLGYRVGNTLVNKDAGVRHIRGLHYVTGVEVNLKSTSRITLEAYYKGYDFYPLLSRENISLANLGGDFGVLGNEPVTPVSDGRAYGVEILFQQRLFKGFYGILAYTLGYSEFTNGNYIYVPSSWDARHILNLTMGKQLGKNWEIGIRYRYQDGLPLTPFSDDSNLVINWQRNFGGIPDFTQLNTLRSGPQNILDMRLDKKWFFKGWDLNIYLDIQNVAAQAIDREVLILDRPLDADGAPNGSGIILNPSDPFDQQRYAIKSINDAIGTRLPTIGVVITR